MTMYKYHTLALCWQRAFNPPAVVVGWSDCRCTAYLEFQETAQHYHIVTNFYGLVPETLGIKVQGAYLIVEGALRPEIMGHGGYGRYARHLPFLKAEKFPFTEVHFLEDGTLSVKLWKSLQ